MTLIKSLNEFLYSLKRHLHASKYFNYNLERMFGAPKDSQKPSTNTSLRATLPWFVWPLQNVLSLREDYENAYNAHLKGIPWEGTRRLKCLSQPTGYLKGVALPRGVWLKGKLLLSSIQLLMGLCCSSFSLFRKRWIFMWNLWTFDPILKKSVWANLNTNGCWI